MAQKPASSAAGMGARRAIGFAHTTSRVIMAVRCFGSATARSCSCRGGSAARFSCRSGNSHRCVTCGHLSASTTESAHRADSQPSIVAGPLMVIRTGLARVNHGLCPRLSRRVDGSRGRAAPHVKSFRAGVREEQDEQDAQDMAQCASGRSIHPVVPVHPVESLSAPVRAWGRLLGVTRRAKTRRVGGGVTGRVARPFSLVVSRPRGI